MGRGGQESRSAVCGIGGGGMTQDEMTATAEDIVTQIMTQHWDLIACACWVCKAGRRIGLGAVEEHLSRVSGVKFPRVNVEEGEV